MKTPRGRAARVALERGKAFPHTLLLGPPGMGKTSLAEAVAREMKAPIHRVFGTILEEGLVVRTFRGRALTEKGREVLAVTADTS